MLTALLFATLAIATDEIPLRHAELSLQGQKLSVAYREVAAADGPGKLPVVFLHGKYQSGRYWEDSLRQAAALGHRALAPDLPGFGQSQRAAIRLSSSELAHATARLLEGLGMKRFLLVGHSLGGYLAARLALIYPGRVERLLLESPAGLEDYRRTHLCPPLDEVLAREKKATRESIRTLFGTFFYRWKDSYNSLAVDAWARYDAPDRALTENLSAQAYLMLCEEPLAGELTRLSMPLTLVTGDKDEINLSPADLRPAPAPAPRKNADLARALRGSVKKIRVVTYTEAGHTPHLEEAAPFARELGRFLKPGKSISP